MKMRNGRRAIAGILAGLTLLLGSGPAYAAAFWAVVDSDGTLDRGKSVVSTQRLSTGQYEVIFKKNVRRCAYLASIGLVGSEGVEDPGQISVVGRFTDERGVFIETTDSTGTNADRGFHLNVIC